LAAGWQPTASALQTRDEILGDASYRVKRRLDDASLSLVGLTLRVKLCGQGPRAEADAARRLPPLRLMRCGRRAAVILVS